MANRFDDSYQYRPSHDGSSAFSMSPPKKNQPPKTAIYPSTEWNMKDHKYLGPDKPQNDYDGFEFGNGMGKNTGKDTGGSKVPSKPKPKPKAPSGGMAMSIPVKQGANAR